MRVCASLVEEWGHGVHAHASLVKLGHMACVVGGGGGDGGGGDHDDDDDGYEGGGCTQGDGGGGGGGGTATSAITFLYHLEAGSSPRSFGVNVARLARLPPKVLALAAAQSAAFEDALKASSSWQRAVGLGKRLLASIVAADAADAATGAEGGGAAAKAAAVAAVRLAWERAQSLDLDGL